jgi:hypothetical protein
LVKVTSRSGETVFTLELDEQEMQYLASVLVSSDTTEQSPFGADNDPLFDYVTIALENAGIDYSSTWSKAY